jgi:hypothetical protein
MVLIQFQRSVGGESSIYKVDSIFGRRVACFDSLPSWNGAQVHPKTAGLRRSRQAAGNKHDRRSDRRTRGSTFARAVSADATATASSGVPVDVWRKELRMHASPILCGARSWRGSVSRRSGDPLFAVTRDGCPQNRNFARAPETAPGISRQHDSLMTTKQLRKAPVTLPLNPSSDVDSSRAA